MQTVQIIEAMLAPGILISACGLFLLGMNNKYSLVVNRIRTLNEELRSLMIKSDKEPLPEKQATRLENIRMQIDKLYNRIHLVRNAVVSYSTAVGFFIATCLSIGVQFVFGETVVLSSISLVLFIVGLAFLLTGIIFAVKEVQKGFEIVGIEVEHDAH
ncbi:DUF2721 domain-containing protein [Microbacter margulisiae]|uniref:DUF2721 domain-containing protein n=1 Tax=Microbacter margulisiae TaxID=1350067 RepID=A0A7W5H1P3_9PORP|nr:DUF2721 domain-containing protein [Microbacter margulisiae]MBB3186591.1 hypothetical protein [Microbacter margulisiae]